MKKNLKIFVFYCSGLLLLSTYSFTKYIPNLLLVGTKWFYYSSYSNPCCGGHGWCKVSNLDSKKYFELLDRGKTDGDYFDQSSYIVKDSITFAIAYNNKRVVEYHYNINNDTLFLTPANFCCKEGCGWKFIKAK